MVQNTIEIQYKSTLKVCHVFILLYIAAGFRGCSHLSPLNSLLLQGCVSFKLVFTVLCFLCHDMSQTFRPHGNSSSGPLPSLKSMNPHSPQTESSSALCMAGEVGDSHLQKMLDLLLQPKSAYKQLQANVKEYIWAQDMRVSVF